MKPVCIFDLDNVLVRFSPTEITELYFNDREEAKMVRQVMFDRLYWDRLERGTLEDKAFKSYAFRRIYRRLHSRASRVYDQWYRHLPEIKGMRELLHDLRGAGKKLYLLANTTKGFEQGKRCVPVFRELLPLFDGCVFSSAVGMAKPDRGIYLHLLEKYELRREDCVFIDDNLLNIIEAQRLGIESILFEGDVSALRERLLPQGSTA